MEPAPLADLRDELEFLIAHRFEIDLHHNRAIAEPNFYCKGRDKIYLCEDIVKFEIDICLKCNCFRKYFIL